MCGVFGIMQRGAGASVPPPAPLLQAAARLLHHRGPDGCGVHAEPGVGLVSTRLSLVDLHERSNQPLWDATGRYALVYNGELYDYAGLKSGLLQRGLTFRTTSDTEVLLLALIHLGAEPVLAELDGMFAFGLYDRRERSLLLGRDRFGIKPLYTHRRTDRFLFASTVAAMRPWLELAPDRLTVSSYLQGFNGPMAGRSFYHEVEMVPPGSLIRVSERASPCFSRFHRMRDLDDPTLAESLRRTPRAELIDQVESRLLQSVTNQLVADAQVGVFCSGGVDSSLIMAMAARSHQNLKVFHADVVGPQSERRGAEALARYLNLDFYAVEVRDQDFLDTLPLVAEHFEFPVFVHPTSIPLRMVSQLVRDQGAKAVLSGEGADECYFGYPWLAPDLLASLPRLPRRLWRRTLAALGSGPQSGSEGLDLSDADRNLVIELPHQFESALGPPAYGETEERTDWSASKLSLALGGELSYILRTLLHRNDTMGMAAGVEGRFPFLDHRLVKLAVNLPYEYKIRFSPLAFDRRHLFFRDKWIIRTIANRYVPRAFGRRIKQMFPTSAYQRFAVADGYFADSVVPDWFALPGSRLQYLLDRASHGLRLRLFFLDVWAQVCLRGASEQHLGRRIAEHVRVAPLR